MTAPVIPPALLLGYIEEHGPVDTLTTIAAFGVAPPVIWHRLRKLALAGLIERAAPLQTRANNVPRKVTRWQIAVAPAEATDDADDERDTFVFSRVHRPVGTWERRRTGAAPAGPFDGLAR